MPGGFHCLPEVHLSRNRTRRVPARVKTSFDEATNGKEHMDAADLSGFLAKVQGDPTIDEVKAADMISKWHTESRSHSHHIFGSHGSRGKNPLKAELDLQAFFSFLLQYEVNRAEAAPSKPTHDMTAPLPHYYMHTSHNSYLTGNQLTSKSSTAPIVKALQSGCRVIELDCWERKGKIMVLHGNTLTKPVAFADCIKAIKEHAFVASEYPVIITIENHLKVEVQQQAAQIIVETLGDLLFIPPPEERPPKVYRSPEDLKRKIIISDKPVAERVDEQVADDPDGAAEVIPDLLVAPTENDPPRKVVMPKAKDAAKFTVQKAAAAMAAMTHKPEDPVDEQHELAVEFEQLLYIYCEKPSEMKDAVNGHNELVCGRTCTMANLSEAQMKKFVQKNASSLIEYTKTNLGRMYPFGLRFDSSNADPMTAWCHGFQLAAMNMQGQNRSSWVAEAFFKANARCGYLKKPDIFLQETSVDDEYIANLPLKLFVKVKVLTATDWRQRFEWFKKPDFFVKLGMHGVPADHVKKRTATANRTKEPIWEDEEFEFLLKVPEIAILRLEVWEEDVLKRNEFAGQACIPVRLLQSGIRNIPLCSKKNSPNGAKMLCEFSVEPLNGFTWKES